jgi:hypothetical protein
MDLFANPADPLGRYIDSWTPATGVTSYGGYVNEHFQDDAINCTIKWIHGQPTAGIYAKSWQEFQTEARSHMLHPLAHDTPAAIQKEDAQDSTPSSP